MSTFTEYTNLTYHTVQCGECGVFFAMENRLYNDRMENGHQFYCPNGHNRVFSESEVDRLKKQLEAKERELRTTKCDVLRLENEKSSVERKLKRVKNGVCPCCRRGFQNLARHMAHKHPDFLKVQ